MAAADTRSVLPHRARRPAAEPLPLRVLLRRPLLVALSGVSLVALTLLGLAVLVVPVLGNRITTYDRMAWALQDSHVAMLNQETGLRGYLITREERFLQPYEAGVADLEAVDAEIASWTGVDTELAGRLAELTTAHQEWTEDWVRPMLAEQPAVGDAVALAELLGQDKALFDHYRAVEAQARAAVEERRAGAMALQQLALYAGALSSGWARRWRSRPSCGARTAGWRPRSSRPPRRCATPSRHWRPGTSPAAPASPGRRSCAGSPRTSTPSGTCCRSATSWSPPESRTWSPRVTTPSAPGRPRPRSSRR